MTLPELKVPWHPVAEKNAAKLVLELEREVGPQHALHGKKVRAIAVRQDCDDVLFAIESDPPSCAVVHLTWSGQPDWHPKFPSAEIFPTLEEWHRSRMLPDHEDFIAE